jgi:hypothetical protein
MFALALAGARATAEAVLRPQRVGWAWRKLAGLPADRALVGGVLAVILFLLRSQQLRGWCSWVRVG